MFSLLLLIGSMLLSGCRDILPEFITPVPPAGPQKPAVTETVGVAEPTQPVSERTPAAFPACIPEDAVVEIGSVVGITDGDTIHVVIDAREYTLRYTSIDAPEATREIEPFGPEATEKNRELVEGKRVTLIKDVSETDRFGRLLRYVFVGSTFVNYELVRQGYANAASFPPDVACLDFLREAEDQARSEGAGFWASEAGSQGGIPACSCSGPDKDCSNFTMRAEAQACFDTCLAQGLGDIFHLDGEDQDGRVCEAMP